MGLTTKITLMHRPELLIIETKRSMTTVRKVTAQNVRTAISHSGFIRVTDWEFSEGRRTAKGKRKW